VDAITGFVRLGMAPTYFLSSITYLMPCTSKFAKGSYKLLAGLASEGYSYFPVSGFRTALAVLGLGFLYFYPISYYAPF
jgi:hypothetical protein